MSSIVQTHNMLCSRKKGSEEPKEYEEILMTGNGSDFDLELQKRKLFNISKENSILFEIIQQAQALEITDYYIGAGNICQTVLNYQNHLGLMYGISDVDFVYFDADTSYEIYH